MQSERLFLPAAQADRRAASSEGADTATDNRREFSVVLADIIGPYQRGSWWHGTVVERRSLAGELSLSCARPAADG